MAIRKWLVRSLFLAFLASLVGGGLLVYAWMRPEFIREELTHQLAERFTNIEIEVDTAHLRILGGIAVSDLKFVRRDDPRHTPLLFVPSAILHHDKEQLNNGKLVIRKIEMFKPRLLVERDAQGKWNFAGIVKPPSDDEPLPIFILHQATIVFIDRRMGEAPVAEWRDVEATIINDPIAVFSFQVRGAGLPTGSFALDGKYDRRNGGALALDLPALPLGAELYRVLAAFHPEAAEYARPLTGRAAAHLEYAWREGPTPASYHDLRIQVQQGRYEHAGLPLPIEQIEADVRSRNGDVTIDKATARFGQAALTVSLDLPREPPCAPRSTPLAVPSVSGSLAPEPSPLQDFEDRLRSLELAASNLAITPELCDCLPGRACVIRKMFAPAGPLNFNFSLTRQEGRWQKRLVLEPRGMAATYNGFPYRMHNLRGKIQYTAGEGVDDHIQIDLLGEGAGATVSVRGTIKGSHPDTEVDLRIAGNGMTLDKELIDAMPDDNPDLLRRLHATARGDFLGLIRHNERIRREYGPDTFANEFTIVVRNSSMKFDEFPYPLENMTGKLIVRTVPDQPTRLPSPTGEPPRRLENGDTTTLEFHDFRATRNGARIRGSGRKDPAPGGAILLLNLDAEALALDQDLQTALAAIHVTNAWQSFAPSGRVNFGVRTKLHIRSDSRAPLNPAEDLELSLAFAGGTIEPTFFPYVLHDLAGRVSYGKGRAVLRDFRARHGAAEIVLPLAEVLFRPSGGYWADLRDLHVAPLVLDEPFRAALPAGLGRAVEALEPGGSMVLQADRMVIDDQPGPHVPHQLPASARGAAPGDNPPALTTSLTRPAPEPILPTIYWDGRVKLAGASLNTGVAWENIHGTVASRGLYRGDHLGAVRANLVFDRALLAKQPVEAVSVSLEVDPRQPDALSITAIRGKLFGGDIGGAARVMLDSPSRYAVQLNATRVRLDDVARHYNLPSKSHLEGLANAQIYLVNRPDERTGELVLSGGGSIDIPNGKLLNLPVLLNLIKVVKLRIPDDTGFEEAHALFQLHGERVRFSQLDLIGNAISLGGEGEMKTDGSEVQFEFYPIWTKLKEMFALPGDWTGVISKKFLKIKVTGNLDGKLDYHAEPVPSLVDPVKRVLDLISH